MTARALRRIERELNAMIAEERVTADDIRLAAIRIGAQAEMLERGLEP